jgi:GNAT superfamily N-acetyltransferase
LVGQPAYRQGDQARPTELCSCPENYGVSVLPELCSWPENDGESAQRFRKRRQGRFFVVFVSDEDARIVSTCMLITAPNLLRGSRPHGMIENVVTHPACQRRGHGRAVIGAALDQGLAAGVPPGAAAKRPGPSAPARVP